eukprot:363203-Chlamydomonas_euryale.AAC.2
MSHRNTRVGCAPCDADCDSGCKCGQRGVLHMEAACPQAVFAACVSDPAAAARCSDKRSEFCFSHVGVVRCRCCEVSVL